MSVDFLDFRVVTHKKVRGCIYRVGFELFFEGGGGGLGRCVR